MERTVQCHCGSLRVIASGEPERLYMCHCRACQHRTGAVVHSRCTYPKSQVRIEGDNKIYERDADQWLQDPLPFLPKLRQRHFVALAARTGRQQRLLGRRPEAQHLRDRGGELR